MYEPDEVLLEDPEDKAQRLAETLINGNISDAARETVEDDHPAEMALRVYRILLESRPSSAETYRRAIVETY